MVYEMRNAMRETTLCGAALLPLAYPSCLQCRSIAVCDEKRPCMPAYTA